MADNVIHDAKVCSIFHHAIEIIGKKWAGAIIYTLCDGSKRFSEIQESIPDISPRLLTERLKELEDYKIILREVTTDRPIQVFYSLTPKGLELKPIFNSIQEWAVNWKK
ncbi:MAG: helix-turn-helix domain-containing protein [Candidatus Sericytochromatia bacterium]